MIEAIYIFSYIFSSYWLTINVFFLELASNKFSEIPNWRE